MEPVWEEVKLLKKPTRKIFQDPPRRSYPDNSDKRKVAQLVYHLAVSETKQNALNSKYQAEAKLLLAAQDQLDHLIAEKRNLEQANERDVALLKSRLQNQQDQLDLLKKQLVSHNPINEQLSQIQSNVQEIQKIIPVLMAQSKSLKSGKADGQVSRLGEFVDNPKIDNEKISRNVKEDIERMSKHVEEDISLKQADSSDSKREQVTSKSESNQRDKDPLTNDSTSMTFDSVAPSSNISESASFGNFERLVETVLSRSNYKQVTLTPNSLVLALDKIIDSKQSPKKSIIEAENQQSAQVSTSSNTSNSAKIDNQSQTEPLSQLNDPSNDHSFIIAPNPMAIESRPKKTTFQIDINDKSTRNDNSLRKDYPSRKDSSLLFFSDNSMIKTLGEIVSDIDNIKINDEDDVYLDDVSEVISSLNGL